MLDQLFSLVIIFGNDCSKLEQSDEMIGLLPREAYDKYKRINMWRESGLPDCLKCTDVIPWGGRESTVFENLPAESHRKAGGT